MELKLKLVILICFELMILILMRCLRLLECTQGIYTAYGKRNLARELHRQVCAYVIHGLIPVQCAQKVQWRH